MTMLVFFAASTAAGMAVKGGAVTISQCLEAETSGANALKNARVSACVLNIFQLPAITRRRTQASKKKEKDDAETQRAQRFRRERGYPFLLFAGEGFHAGQFATAEKFEGGAAPSRNMRDFVGHARLAHGGNRVSSPDDRSCAAGGGFGNGFSDFEGALGEGGHLENAHRTVPDNRFGTGDFLFVGFNRFRAYVQAHPPIRGGG